MTELLAFLTILFIIYCLYEVFKTASQSGAGLHHAHAPKAASPAAPHSPAPPAVATASPEKSAASPAPQAAAAATQEAAPAAATVATPTPTVSKSAVDGDKIINLRNPDTGEVSPVPSNYRFAKKWIKEAMVTEGLLKKVYKNSELTEAVNTKAKEAIDNFRKLDKYHG